MDKSGFSKRCSKLKSLARKLPLQRMKPWITLLVCILIVAIGLILLSVVVVKITHVGSSSTDSFATNEDLLDAYRFVNDSLSLPPSDQGESESINSLTLQLLDQVYAIQHEMQSMQSNLSLLLDSEIIIIQNSLTDMKEKIDELRETVQNLTGKGNSLELELSNVRKHVSELAMDIGQLEVYTGNLTIGDRLQDMEHALAHGNTSELIAHLKSAVAILATDQNYVLSKIATLQQNISQLGSELHTLHDSIQQQSARAQNIASYSNRLDQMENSVTSLSTLVHSPVSLYSGCRTDTAHCRIAPIMYDDYWRDCATEYLPIHREGWYTVNYECHHTSSTMTNIEVQTPFVDNERVRCDCDVVFPGNATAPHHPISQGIRASCTLVVLRCPLTQTLF